MNRGRRPSIHQIGRVTDDGHTIVISGWGLALCAAHCTCHRHPLTGQLVIAGDRGTGDLGLARFRPCDCCQPWTADELAAVLKDLADVATLETTA